MVHEILSARLDAVPEAPLNAQTVRLSGIDCPEKGQAFGSIAKHAVADLAFGKEVAIQTHGHDKYKRTLGDVILPDGMNLNQELVKQGRCWWYRKFQPLAFGLQTLARLAHCFNSGADFCFGLSCPGFWLPSCFLMDSSSCLSVSTS
jgi:endonuclease YncB( thermonuclease family)